MIAIDHAPLRANNVPVLVSVRNPTSSVNASVAPKSAIVATDGSVTEIVDVPGNVTPITPAG